MYFFEERIQRIIAELGGYIHSDGFTAAPVYMKQGNFAGGEKPDADISDWEIFEPGSRWGGRNTHCWFRTNVAIPENLAGKTVVFEVRTGREGEWDALNPQFLAYRDGVLIQGLDVNHREFVISEGAAAGDSFCIALYAYSGMKEGLVELRCGISSLDRNIEKLYYDLKVPLEAALLLGEGDKRRIDTINCLNEAVNLLDLRKPGSEAFHSSITKSGNYLEEEFYKKLCGTSDVTANCVGHTHIDVAWLWTLSQTREKTARSFSTVIELMKHYPEYIFMSSQPQLYKYIKEDHPEIYEQIKERIREGRWEAEGGMWLEADCNISSGESLVRQVLFGTRFFKEEFGVENRILWLPDVFGYSAALPQILKKSGIDYFMTTKISWNEYNKLPYDTFMWQGLDGTAILTHFITTSHARKNRLEHFTTYNGDIIPAQVKGSWDRYQQKDFNNETLISYGYGDGGGGPTKEMLENARRLEKGIPGIPKVKLTTARDFFDRLNEKAASAKRLPDWVGELYLEYHRGTYTSMARNKKFNRKCEFLYQDAELLSVIGTYAAGAAEYPQDTINKGWETILLNQFHDILPGSSIKEVYDESREQYLEVLKSGREMAAEAITRITGNINTAGPSIVVFNQLGFARNDIVKLALPPISDLAGITDNAGKAMPYQIVESSDESGVPCKKLLFLAEQVPSKGYKAFKVSRAPVSHMDMEPQELTANRSGMSNKFFDLKFDAQANIVSIYDKTAQREIVMAGNKANVLQAFEDKPHKYDAWDVNIYYSEKMWEINDLKRMEVIEEGPVRACVEIERSFLDSIIVQRIYLYSHIPRIDFSTAIDWKERQLLLKAAFPVDVHSDKATYEIQYGNVERPTHWNTSWDYARFEVCAHKWADLSEAGFGVSLLNDCKYGYDIRNGNMRLTLLKSAAYPNEDADRELHEFTYSLYPHEGDWRSGDTVSMAYSLNCPMYAEVTGIKNASTVPAGALPEEFSLISLDCGNVVIETVKKAEDSDAVIIRLYECHNRRSRVRATLFTEPFQVMECGLMENELETVEASSKCFDFEIKPYEIKTFKIILK